MTTMHIQVDETVAEAIRKKAREAGKSPEVWAAEVVAQQAAPPPNKEWIKKFLEDADRVRGNSGGKTWTRDELYER